MYAGFNLSIDKDAGIFQEYCDFPLLKEIGEDVLKSQKASYEKDLKKYVTAKELDGTKIQNEWFPQIEADIFISHSHNDRELACALAGWVYRNFGLTCFIDSNVWGYSEELLEEMNGKLSNRRSDGRGGYLYDHASCNRVSQHVNTMLTIALQKMIDKVEAVIFLNTDNSIQVCDDDEMDKTYSPWIYSEIICSQIIRKKPLLAYRDYKTLRINKSYTALSESMQLLMHSAVSYKVSLEHLMVLTENDLLKWREEYFSNETEYEYQLDALYDSMCPNEVENTRKLFGTLERGELYSLKQAYSAENMSFEAGIEAERAWNRVLQRSMQCCEGCDRVNKG